MVVDKNNLSQVAVISIDKLLQPASQPAFFKPARAEVARAALPSNQLRY